MCSRSAGDIRICSGRDRHAARRREGPPRPTDRREGVTVISPGGRQRGSRPHHDLCLARHHRSFRAKIKRDESDIGRGRRADGGGDWTELSPKGIFPLSRPQRSAFAARGGGPFPAAIAPSRAGEPRSAGPPVRGREG
ncbi:hypothetical protein NL676_039460 [Syzygium grande]|nr:hypothetical protein NL676_039460 [Syzygium grande]